MDRVLLRGGGGEDVSRVVEGGEGVLSGPVGRLNSEQLPSSFCGG